MCRILAMPCDMKRKAVTMRRTPRTCGDHAVISDGERWSLVSMANLDGESIIRSEAAARALSSDRRKSVVALLHASPTRGDARAGTFASHRCVFDDRLATPPRPSRTAPLA